MNLAEICTTHRGSKPRQWPKMIGIKYASLNWWVNQRYQKLSS